jgi:hypothetical protein
MPLPSLRQADPPVGDAGSKLHLSEGDRCTHQRISAAWTVSLPGLCRRRRPRALRVQYRRLVASGEGWLCPDIPSLDFQLVISSKAGRYPDLTIPSSLALPLPEIITTF